jgi:hypothetical protein
MLVLPVSTCHTNQPIFAIWGVFHEFDRFLVDSLFIFLFHITNELIFPKSFLLYTGWQACHD